MLEGYSRAERHILRRPAITTSLNAAITESMQCLAKEKSHVDAPI